MAKKTTPTIYNKTMTDADTEYSQALSSGCIAFLIKCRGDYAIKLAFVENASGTTYITVPAGQSYYEEGLWLNGVTLYIQCATAAQVAEIIEWK